MVQKQRKIGGLRAFMSKLDEAEQRLQRAVAGLEEAARAVASSSTATATASAPDPAVAAELAAAQARTTELEQANKAVAQRLDGAIARIKTILED
jgi:hypothetical protein